MSNSEQWRPKVGERVQVSHASKYAAGKIGVVMRDDGSHPEKMPFHVEVAPGEPYWLNLSELSPLPAPPAPRPAWEVLREAARILDGRPDYESEGIYSLADWLEAAAAPKVLTLADAAEEMLVAFAEGVSWTAEQKSAYEALHAALALSRAEAGQ